MSKKQVILMSLLVAVPALALVAVFVIEGLANSANFSGIMWGFVVVAGALALCLVAMPFVLMALYPTDGFAGMPLPAGDAPAGSPPPADSDDDDEFEAGDGEDGFAAGGFDEEDELADAGGGEEIFDDGFEEEAYDDEDLGDFEEDDEEWT